jgi:hypothetical protein
VLLDFSLQGFLPAIRDYDGADLAAAFHDSENWSLIFSASASDPTTALGNVHVPRLAADEGFVRFDMAACFLDRAIM